MAGRIPPIIYHFVINVHAIQTVKSAKYQLIMVCRVTGKANSVLAFLQRNLYHCLQGLKANAIVADVWSQCYIHQVQRKAARLTSPDIVV